MLAMDDILKNRIYLLDRGLKVSLNPTRQLNIFLSFVPPPITFGSQPKQSVRCRKRPVYKFRSLTRLTKQWQVLLFIAGIGSAHTGLTQGTEKAAACYAPPARHSALSTIKEDPSSWMHTFAWCSAFLVHLKLGEQMLNTEMVKERSLG